MRMIELIQGKDIAMSSQGGGKMEGLDHDKSFDLSNY